MNPVDKILGRNKFFRRDIGKNRIYYDKDGNIIDTDAYGNKKIITVEKEDKYGNFEPIKIGVVNTTGKVGKINVEKEVFDIVDNPKLTQTQKEKMLKPYEAYIKAKGWRFW
jgi:hypothetical protein